MPLERLIGESSQVFQKSIEVTEDKELDVNEQVVIVGTTTGNITITLPPVGEAIGKFFSVVAPTIFTDTNAVTLQDNNESYDWTDKTLDADDDGILLFSDGRKWWVITNDIA